VNQKKISATYFFGITAALAALFLFPQRGLSWGAWAHQFITRKAVALMPAECRHYFVAREDSLVAHSIDPDLWRKTDPDEGRNHYIDLDLLDSFPYANIPRNLDAAAKKYGMEQIYKAGLLPWRIAAVQDSLVFAMQQRDSRAVFRYLTALAHYIEDAHMPLHTVSNYNGQLSGNDGIHSRYETEMVVKFKSAIAGEVQPDSAQQLAKPIDAVFSWILSSTVWADNLLLADTHARVPGKVYGDDADFDDRYYRALFSETGDFTVLQLSRAATAVASAWYTAWQMAGRPELLSKN